MTTRSRWTVGVTLAVFVLLYLATVLLYSRSTNRDLNDLVTPTPPNGVGLSFEVTAIDPTKGEVTTLMRIDPADQYMDGADLKQDLRVVVFTALDPNVVFKAGQIPAAVPVVVRAGGSYQNYPFDSWVAPLFATATTGSGASIEALPSSISLFSNLPGWVTRPLTTQEFLASIPNGSITNNPNGSQDFAGVGLRRSGSTWAVVILILAFMVVLASVAVAVSAAVAQRRRKVEPTLASFMAALLFALVPLRNALPGVPPLGAWMDFLVFFWVEIAIMLALAVYVSTWLRFGAKPENHSSIDV